MIKDTVVFYAEECDAGKRLDMFLMEELTEFSRSHIQKLIEGGNVSIQGISKLKNGYKLAGKEKITVEIPEDQELAIEPEDIPVDIVYEDEWLAVINKAAGVVVHPAPGNFTGTLVNGILFHIKDLSTINGVVRPGIVHRLDKDTTGLIIIAKNDEAHRRLTDMFKNKEIQKTYFAIINGRLKNQAGRVETNIARDESDRKKMAVTSSIRGKNAVTNYEVMAEAKEASLLKITIETGRTHQIRVHMKHINHPIIGDKVYGIKDDKSGAERQMLHAGMLEFTHPISGGKISLTAPIPDDFIEICRKYKLEYEAAER